ncbi:UNVERIFIED_CONTAM: hypothetical protein HDU68_006091 [Siphonaria sp. JEL0065]|nr:hypothetical protein HDU68_006091 [Siphonaria sp. JEL0065]
MLLANHVWAHAVNSHNLLTSAIADSTITAIEADIIFSATKQQAVMGHPPSVDGSLTLFEFLETIATARNKKSITKLDFKSMKAFKAGLSAVKHWFCKENGSGNWHLQPNEDRHQLFLNADILRGPGGHEPLFASFLETALSIASISSVDIVLSVGWTTGENERGVYTENMISEMLQLLDGSGVWECKNVAVTFPIRAPSFLGSWEVLQKLFGRERTSLTLWWSTYEMDSAERKEIQSILETIPNSNRTYYDIK